MWLNRHGLPRPAGLVPDAEVSTLAKLPKVMSDLPATSSDRVDLGIGLGG